ncbi:hypothetical protein M5K25_010171 [Dendrobium thyrsiflorum]|uniref:Uncharacterized protein n=1 Tax=Dendrobium thyrsiflorum TaxID=117978 RepID=A0ABD0V615_DENTH
MAPRVLIHSPRSPDEWKNKMESNQIKSNRIESERNKTISSSSLRQRERVEEGFQNSATDLNAKV